MRTSEIYYEQMNSKDTTDAHDPELSMKQKWSKTEITLLKDHWPLSGTPPVLMECEQHIEQFGMARTANTSSRFFYGTYVQFTLRTSTHST